MLALASMASHAGELVGAAPALAGSTPVAASVIREDRALDPVPAHALGTMILRVADRGEDSVDPSLRISAPPPQRPMPQTRRIQSSRLSTRLDNSSNTLLGSRLFKRSGPPASVQGRRFGFPDSRR
ncbi:hypothetical protein CKO27_20130 [Thiocystis violacea]|nr:hypothetical protein [Thiocystis violacea]